MKKVAIIGGGVSGLIAAWVFHQCGADVRLFEPGEKGRGFLSGGLRYFVRTDEMVRLMNDLGLIFSIQAVRGGLFRHGAVEPYPQCFRTMSDEEVQGVREKHFFKTRGLKPGEFAAKSMNDPFATARKALSCDIQEFVVRLSGYNQRCHLKKCVLSVDHSNKVIYTDDQGQWDYDHLVATTPLWISRKMFRFPLPEAMVSKLNVLNVDVAKPDPYAEWDYVYTPYTIEGLVHRISPNEGGYSVEFNGDWTDETHGRIRNELNFLFGNAWALTGISKGLPGHLLPLGEVAEWPDDVQPLGRFAAWDPRMTTDKTLSSAIALAKKWGLPYEDD